MVEQGQGSEIVLMPNEHCFFLNRTDGNVSVVVGPYKHPLSETHRLVEWSTGEKRFIEVGFASSKRNNIVIPEGWYAALKNPAQEGRHPGEGGIEDLRNAQLMVGKKVNVAGPAAFALWPGQMCKVIEGHKLRSNQYLLVRIYDVDAFMRELSHGEEKKNDSGNDQGDGDASALVARKTDIYGGIDAGNLATGQQFIIKGTDVHFYIPPDGMEVVATYYSEKPKYVQDAVTLEQLQYCILQDENGNKRYVRGPDVVFPEPTEKFLKHTSDNRVASKKFTAIELNEKSGLYVKVIKPYKDESLGLQREEGDELFITGAEQRIYFPREEHAIIKYGNQDRYYGVAMPKGDGRYVLDRVDGKIRMEMGPQMFLPDPRQDVVVRRVLSDKEARLIFPGNEEVSKYNTLLRGQTEGGANRNQAVKGSAREREMDMMLRSALGSDEMSNGGRIEMYASSAPDMFSAHLGNTVEEGVMGDSIDRDGQYVPPRSITLDSKFEGIVTFNVWNGFAVMVVDREGNRRVIEGPKRAYLDYDETPEVLTLSKGRPKKHDRVVETVFLRVRNNVVGDIIGVKTKDLCGASIQLSMHVDFLGDDDESRQKWFAVDNYVKLLCERVGSLLKNHIRKLGVMEFYSNSTNIVRDIILGEKNTDGRTGLVFDEIGMLVSDVEVLEVTLSDDELEDTLERQASDALNKALDIERVNREKDYERQVIEANKEIEGCRHNAEVDKMELIADIAQKRDANVKEEKDRKKELSQLEIEIEREKFDAEIANEVAKMDAVIKGDRERLKIQTELMSAEAEKTREVMESISPDLTAALSALGDNDRIAKLASAVSPQAVFGDEGVLELMKAQFGALGFDKLLDRVGLKTIGDASKVDAKRIKETKKKK